MWIWLFGAASCNDSEWAGSYQWGSVQKVFDSYKTPESWVPFGPSFPLSSVTLRCHLPFLSCGFHFYETKHFRFLQWFSNFLRYRALSSKKTFLQVIETEESQDWVGGWGTRKEMLNLSLSQTGRIVLGIFPDPIPPELKPRMWGERQSQLFLQFPCWRSFLLLPCPSSHAS